MTQVTNLPTLTTSTTTNIVIPVIDLSTKPGRAKQITLDNLSRLSVGPLGPQGFVGSRGQTGFIGSLGYSGSLGYVGSRGNDGTSFNVKGNVQYRSQLGTVSSPSINDGWIVTSEGHIYVYTGVGPVYGFIDGGSVQGPPGDIGPIGYTGSQGITGFFGSTGYVGSKGYVGSIGFYGSIGYAGSLGSSGFIGSLGYYGSIGYVGSRGDVGFSGATGWTGSAGFRGSTGYTGSVGSTGFNGSLGYTGSKGLDGTGLTIKDAITSSSQLPASGATKGDAYINTTDGHLWIYTISGPVNGFSDFGPILGYTGSKGFTGSIGYWGSVGYVGSASTAAGYTGSLGYWGSVGYVGSASTAVGYTGSIGFIGSKGFTGSIGYYGSIGYVGSLGYWGSIGYIGSKGVDGTSVRTRGSVLTATTSNFQTLYGNGTITPILGDGYIAQDTGNLWVYTGPTTSAYYGFVNAGLIRGPQGDPGAIGYTGSRGANTKSITIPSPLVGDSFTMFYTNQSLTTSEIRSILVGSNTPSVSYSIRFASDRSTASPTNIVTSGLTSNSITTGNSTTSFNSPTIPSGSFVWIYVSAVSGIVSEFNVTMIF